MNISLNDGIVFRKLDDEIIILNISNSCYYGVKKSGIEIFEYIAEKKKCALRDIISFIKSEYNVPISDEILKNDITGLLKELALENIVTIIENQDNSLDNR